MPPASNGIYKTIEMEIIDAATNWAKAEIISALLFIFFGVTYVLIAIACWQFGSTPLTKALVIPILIAGGLLLSAGISFYVSNNSMLKKFESEYKTNPLAVVKSEIERTENTAHTYERVALKVFPAIVIVAALICFFISNPIVRAISIAIIAFLLVLVVLDSQALKRIKIYHQKLELVDEQLRKN